MQSIANMRDKPNSVTEVSKTYVYNGVIREIFDCVDELNNPLHLHSYTLDLVMDYCCDSIVRFKLLSDDAKVRLITLLPTDWGANGLTVDQFKKYDDNHFGFMLTIQFEFTINNLIFTDWIAMRLRFTTKFPSGMLLTSGITNNNVLKVWVFGHQFGCRKSDLNKGVIHDLICGTCPPSVVIYEKYKDCITCFNESDEHEYVCLNEVGFRDISWDELKNRLKQQNHVQMEIEWNIIRNKDGVDKYEDICGNPFFHDVLMFNFELSNENSDFIHVTVDAGWNQA